jgi:hypothetical protein
MMDALYTNAANLGAKDVSEFCAVWLTMPK